MDKAHAHGSIMVVMQQGIEQIIAHKRARRVGHAARQAGLRNGACHFPHRHGGKVRRRSVLGAGNILRLQARVVRDGGIAQVNGHHLGRDRRAAARLPHAQDDIGMQRLRLLDGALRRQPKHRGHLQSVHDAIAHARRQAGYRLPGRIDALPAEGVKAGDQQTLGHGRSLLWLLRF